MLAVRGVVATYLVTKSVLGSRRAGRDVSVGVLSDVLVGLLGSTRGGLVDLVTDEVGSVPFDRCQCHARQRRRFWYGRTYWMVSIVKVVCGLTWVES
jgi:hypothetical protein